MPVLVNAPWHSGCAADWVLPFAHCASEPELPRHEQWCGCSQGAGLRAFW
jgi:hypothetical protein